MGLRVLLWLCWAVSFGTAGIGTAWAAATTAEAFFNPSFGDLKEELAQAKAQGKQGIFIFFEMDECPFCRRMRTTVLNQPAVQHYFQTHFINISIDIEGDVDMVDFQGKHWSQKAWAMQNRVRATPVLAFFDLTGQRVFLHTGAAKDSADFLLMGQYIVESAYLKMPFLAYKQQPRSVPVIIP